MFTALSAISRTTSRNTAHIKVEIRPIQTEDYQAWDGYVLAHATPCVYLTTAWKRAVERGYGHQTAYLAAFDDRSLAGVLPLVLIKPPLSRRCLVSLPYCDYGGLVAQSGELASALLLAPSIWPANYEPRSKSVPLSQVSN